MLRFYLFYLKNISFLAAILISTIPHGIKKKEKAKTEEKKTHRRIHL